MTEYFFLRSDGMNRMRLGILLTLLFAFSFLFLIPSARAQSKTSDDETAPIRQVIDEFLAAFNRHDARAWAMPFGKDGDFTNVSGLTRHGEKEVEERFQKLFATSLKDAHRTVTVRHIRFVKPDVVAADAEWALTGSRATDGSENPVRKGIFTWVMVKKDGRWMFADFHESEFVTMK
jgi:uncharacterized protein (TIGR02246 family)